MLMLKSTYKMPVFASSLDDLPWVLKHLDRRYGTHGIEDARKDGKDKPAIVPYKEEKLIIINLDHDLVKNLLELRPLQRNIALGYLLARGHFHILEHFVNLYRYEEFVDNMVATLFSKMIGEVA